MMRAHEPVVSVQGRLCECVGLGAVNVLTKAESILKIFVCNFTLIALKKVRVGPKGSS